MVCFKNPFYTCIPFYWYLRLLQVHFYNIMLKQNSVTNQISLIIYGKKSRHFILWDTRIKFSQLSQKNRLLTHSVFKYFTDLNQTPNIKSIYSSNSIYFCTGFKSNRNINWSFLDCNFSILHHLDISFIDTASVIMASELIRVIGIVTTQSSFLHIKISRGLETNLIQQSCETFRNILIEIFLGNLLPNDLRGYHIFSHFDLLVIFTKTCYCQEYQCQQYLSIHWIFSILLYLFKNQEVILFLLGFCSKFTPSETVVFPLNKRIDTGQQIDGIQNNFFKILFFLNFISSQIINLRLTTNLNIQSITYKQSQYIDKKIIQMASKYLQKYPVPAGFQQILSDFTREVLRDQPPNIIQYAAKYFEMLEKGDKFQFNSKYNVSKDDKKYELSYNPKNAEEITKKATSIAAKVQDTGKGQQKPKAEAPSSKPAAAAKAEPAAKPKPESTEDKTKNLPPMVVAELQKIFEQLDTSGNGYMQPNQVRSAIDVLVKQYNIPAHEITESEVAQFIDTVDKNDDGLISKREFMNFFAEILAPIFENLTPGGMNSEKTVNAEEVQNFMESQSNNALQQQMMQKFDEIFKEIDVDRNGYITSNQIQRAAQMFSAESGGEVDQNQLDQFVAMVDTNQDGKISKQELFDFFMGLLAAG